MFGVETRGKREKKHKTEPQEYIEAWLIVDGALDEDEIFYSWDAFEKWADKIIREYESDAENKDQIWEIHYTEHPHPLTDEECACSQYKTSHTPYWTSEQ